MNESPVLYDYAADDTGLWVFPVGAANPNKVWQSGRGNWTWGKSKLAAGVLRGEAGTEAVREICALYDYSNDDTGLWVLPTDGSNPVKVWQSGRGNWAWGKSKVIGADIRGIGYPEVCVLYDYGNDGSGLFVFPAGEASPSPADLGRWQDARGQQTWGNSKFAAADVLGKGNLELAFLYNYGGDDTALLVCPAGEFNNPQIIFQLNPEIISPGPTQVWKSGRGNWDWGKSKVIGADVRGTGTPELCVLYDYGNNDTGLWVFPSAGAAPIKVWQSGRGNWTWGNSKLLVADIHGTGKLELAVLYNYGGDDTGLWVFPAGEFNPTKVWQSGRGNWAWRLSKVPSDDDN